MQVQRQPRGMLLWQEGAVKQRKPCVWLCCTRWRAFWSPRSLCCWAARGRWWCWGPAWGRGACWLLCTGAALGQETVPGGAMVWLQPWLVEGTRVAWLVLQHPCLVV